MEGSLFFFDFFFTLLCLYATGYEDIYPLILQLTDETNMHYHLISVTLLHIYIQLLSYKSLIYSCWVFLIGFSAIYDASAINSDRPVISVFIITIFWPRLQLYFWVFLTNFCLLRSLFVVCNLKLVNCPWYLMSRHYSFCIWAFCLKGIDKSYTGLELCYIGFLLLFPCLYDICFLVF